MYKYLFQNARASYQLQAYTEIGDFIATKITRYNYAFLTYNIYCRCGFQFLFQLPQGIYVAILHGIKYRLHEGPTRIK